MGEGRLRILVSGSSGFVGRYLFSSDWNDKYHLSKAIRVSDTSYPDIMPNSDICIHLAGLAHQKNSDDLAYEKSNVVLTEDILHKSIQSGVGHFIYFSSIKVLGEENNSPYTEMTNPKPKDYYASSKLRAENLVRRICVEKGIEYTIIRPPLLYGPEPKANILSLVRWIQKNRPVPIATKPNQRSLLSLSNLKDFLETIMQKDSSRNQTLLVQDPIPVSTEELATMIGKSLGTKTRFLRIPNGLGKASGFVTGQSKKWVRLAGSLFVDDRYTRDILEWQPPFETKNSIDDMVRTSFNH